MNEKQCSSCNKLIGKFATKCRYCYSTQIVDMFQEDIIVSTSGSVEGYEVVDQCGFIYGEVVCPNGILGAITNGTFFTISALTDAREKAISALKEKAKILNANALIGLDLDISDLDGNGILVSANATAVVVIPNDIQRLEEERNQKLQEEKKQKEQIFAEQMERAKKKEQIEVEKLNVQLNEQLKEISMEISDLSELDRILIKMFTKHTLLNSMTIMRGAPKNIAYSDISASLNKLVENGIIERDSDGNYRSRVKTDDEGKLTIR